MEVSFVADSKDINITLGNSIKYMRKQHNITREKLAEKINVSPRFLAEVESGKVGVSLSTLKSLCYALNISSDYLLGISFLDDKDIYITSINNKIKNMDTNTLKNVDNIVDCIINIKKIRNIQ
jgi:transcriptional regulator with XRE-family HTH domain